MFSELDKSFMERALMLAGRAQEQGEVPVGAVIVKENQIIGEGWNSPIQQHDPSAHAEMIALRYAAQYLKNYRLVDTTLYVTLEPCLMCAGAIVHARITRLVFGAYDPRVGVASSTLNAFEMPHLNHRVIVDGGLFADQSRFLLQDFFRSKRG